MKTITLAKTRTRVKVAAFAVFLVISVLAPFLKQQFITGPIVNTILFVSTATLGVVAGLLISFLPSLVSALAGLLPLSLLPMIPYIIMGNAILVLTFSAFKKRFFLGVALAAFLKFVFLFLSSSFIVKFFIKRALPAKIIAMMTWPQLITALIGGIIAYFVLKIYEKKDIS